MKETLKFIGLYFLVSQLFLLPLAANTYLGYFGPIIAYVSLVSGVILTVLELWILVRIFVDINIRDFIETLQTEIILLLILTLILTIELIIFKTSISLLVVLAGIALLFRKTYHILGDKTSFITLIIIMLVLGKLTQYTVYTLIQYNIPISTSIITNLLQDKWTKLPQEYFLNPPTWIKILYYTITYNIATHLRNKP